MAGLPSQQDKMSVYNATDSRQDTTNHCDSTVDDSLHANSKPPSKSKSIDGPSKKKGSFQITGVVDRSVGGGSFHANEDVDSVDDLDDTSEIQTEDVSSDILDLSKTTDLETEPPSEETTPSYINDDVSKEFPKFSVQQPVPVPVAPQESKSSTDNQSRFKVVKIESKEPFKRGRWMCVDYLDPNEKTGDRTEKVDDGGSGNSSASSSIHYVHGLDDPSKNPLSQVTLTENSVPETQPVQFTSQVQNGDYTGSSFQHSSQSAASALAQPLLDSAVVTQNVPYDMSTKSMQGQVIPNSTPNHMSNTAQVQVPHPVNQVVDATGSLVPNVAVSHSNAAGLAQHVQIPSVQGRTLTESNVEFIPQNIATLPVDRAQTAPLPLPMTVTQPEFVSASSAPAPTNVIPAASGQVHPVAVVNQSSPKASPNNDNNSEVLQDVAYRTKVDELSKVNMINKESDNESEEGFTGSALPPAVQRQTSVQAAAAAQQNLQNPSVLSPPLLEMVSSMQPNALLKEEGEERLLLNVFSGASTVAIDNKIEQAMDLVKSHLMFAVREEVEVLKEQIKELLEKNNQLEYENSILKAAATPDTLSKLTQTQLPPSHHPQSQLQPQAAQHPAQPQSIPQHSAIAPS